MEVLFIFYMNVGQASLRVVLKVLTAIMVNFQSYVVEKAVLTSNRRILFFKIPATVFH